MPRPPIEAVSESVRLAARRVVTTAKQLEGHSFWKEKHNVERAMFWVTIAYLGVVVFLSVVFAANVFFGSEYKYMSALNGFVNLRRGTVISYVAALIFAPVLYAMIFAPFWLAAMIVLWLGGRAFGQQKSEETKSRD